MSHEETIKRKYYYLYLPRWGGGETPVGWVSVTPIRILGFFIGTKIKMRYSKDNFNDQSEETKTFIGNLLNNK